MKKEDLEKYKELHEIFEEKATEIALLKNKYTYNVKYDYIEHDNDGNEWEVRLVERAHCGCCPDECNMNFYITEEDLLCDIDELEEKLKKEKEEKVAEQERTKKEKEEKEKIQREKREKELYEELKNKYELK